MRVLMVVDARYLHTRRWLRGLATCPIELHSLSSLDPGIDGVAYHQDKVPSWRPWGPDRWIQRRRRMLRRVLERVKPDVVHLQLPGPYSLWPEDLADVPLVVSVWGSEVAASNWQTRHEFELVCKVLRSATNVVVSSHGSAAEAVESAGLAAGAVRVLYWGVDTAVFKPPGEEPRELVIGFSKHLSAIYGPDVLVEAFAQVLKEFPACRLWMAGAGQMESQLKQQALALGIDDQIDWAGHVAHEKMPEMLSRLSVFAMPSRRESLGVAAIEAQAMAIPVVATRVGGIPEVVVHGTTGLLVEPEDPQALADALLILLRDKQLRLAMGKAGRERVVEKFNWSESVDGMINIYRQSVRASVEPVSGLSTASEFSGPIEGGAAECLK